MNKTRLLIVVTTLFVLGISIFLIGQARTLTFQEFLNDFLEEDEEVTKITLRNVLEIQNEEYEAIIEDQQTIDRILTEPSMRLQKRIFPTSPNFDFDNVTVISLSTSKYKHHHFYLDQSFIHIGRTEYKIKRESTSHDLMDVIRNEDLEWHGIFK